MIDIVKCEADKKIQAHAKELGFQHVLGKKDILVREGGSEDQNRAYVSDRNIAILMNPEAKSQIDKMHSRRSGLNQVLAKLAKENDVAIGFGFRSLLYVDSVTRAMILGRMKQNVKICQKSGTKMIVCSYASDLKELRGAKDLVAFARVIGMTGGEAKKALHWERNRSGISIVDS